MGDGGNDKSIAGIAGAAVILGMTVAHFAFDAAEGQVHWPRILARAAVAGVVAAVFVLVANWLRRNRG